MIEEGPRITARRPSDWFARLALGVPVLTSTKLVAIRGLERVEAVEIERDGRRETIACDGVVFTGRFRPETAILAGSHLVLDPGTGGPSHRPALALQRSRLLRRRQSPAPGRDRRSRLG